MNKKFFIAWLVVFLAWFFGSFLIHAVLLNADYKALPAMFRTEQDSQAYFPFMLLAHVMMAGALTWIYSRGAEDKPWAAQGVRFGIAAALLTAVPWYLVYYAVQPMPGVTVAKQVVFDGALLVVLGLVAAFMYRQRA